VNKKALLYSLGEALLIFAGVYLALSGMAWLHDNYSEYEWMGPAAMAFGMFWRFLYLENKGNL